MITRKEYMNGPHGGEAGTANHRRYYAQFVTPAVTATLLRSIDAKRLLASTDKHFNDIGLPCWDRLPWANGLLKALKTADPCGGSLSDKVCIYKEAAQQIRERGPVVPDAPDALMIDKVVSPGIGRNGTVYFHVKYDGRRLSITGVEGPKPDGNARGSSGQICDSLAPNIDRYFDGWNGEALDKFLEVWRHWHLNDLRAGCEHQRAEGWDKRPIDPSKPIDTYGKHFDGQQSTTWNMLAWVTPQEHPDGLLTKPCPVCGYKYGSQWLYEAVPQEIIEYLQSIRETDLTPAWV